MSELTTYVDEGMGVPTLSPLDSDSSAVSSEEFVQLCAYDTELFSRTFFPDIFTQDSPEFHRQVDMLLEDRDNRHVAIKMYRGSGKTTKLRIYALKRIAYGASRTVVLVCRAQRPNAVASLAWIKQQIEENDYFSRMYGLEKGDKWTDDHIEIKHKVLGHSINVIAVGIEGNIRGYNLGGKRPDLIVADDICDDENTKTAEQRQKLRALFFGALDKSIVPRSENPDAKFVFLQTPIDGEDLIAKCSEDPSWVVMTVSCFDEEGESSWEKRFPTYELKADKQAHIARGDLRIWLAEMECTIIGGEGSAFQPQWLKFWVRMPERRVVVVAIDPVPPPSEKAMHLGLKDNDHEVITACSVSSEGYHILDLARMRGHDPDWTVATFFHFLDKWAPITVVVEGVAYQRTLKYILDKEMARRRRFVHVKMSADDKRKKSHRIIQSLKGIATAGRLFAHVSQTDLISQFNAYPYTNHDDDLDAVSMAMEELQRLDTNLEGISGIDPTHEMAPIGGEWRIAP